MTTLEAMVERAQALVPRLRDRASRTEQPRRVPDETIQDFLDAGLFRVLQPKRWGGLELNYGRTQTELCGVLGRACGSSAWVQCVVACHAWCLGMFPPDAQEAVWARESDTLIASAFAFTSGRGRPVEGGYFIEGNWQFSSGSNAWSVFPYNVSTPALGIARGAIDAYVDYTGSRPERANLPQRQLRIAESAAEVDAAEALWLSNASTLERLGPFGGPWTPVLQAKLRRDLAYSTMLCTRAVDRLVTAVGAHGMLEDTPMQRAFRDVHAVAKHGANNWDVQAVPYAREVLGLPSQQVR